MDFESDIEEATNYVSQNNFQHTDTDTVISSIYETSNNDTESKLLQGDLFYLYL